MTKMSRQEAQAHARVLRAFASEYLADGLQTWPGDRDMIAMVRGDAKDFRKIAQLLRANKIQEARNLAGGLDTAAREYIPDSVWDAMIEHCDYTEDEFEDVSRQRLESLKANRAVLDAKIARATKAYEASKRRQ